MIDSKEGIYFRNKDGDSTGPLTEDEFAQICRTPAGRRIASAYRLAGGHAFPIAIQERLKWDVQHACSFAALGHCVELFIIFVCGLATFIVIAIANSKALKKERDAVGPGLTLFIGGLILLTMVLTVLTLFKLVSRWRKVSTDVFTSEV